MDLDDRFWDEVLTVLFLPDATQLRIQCRIKGLYWVYSDELVPPLWIICLYLGATFDDQELQ